MPVLAVAFDIGGVLEVSTDTGLEGRWEQRLGCDPASSSSGCASPAWAGTRTWAGVSEAEFAQALGRLYGLDHPTTEALLVDLWERSGATARRYG
jgi:hypothetical protein